MGLISDAFKENPMYQSPSNECKDCFTKVAASSLENDFDSLASSQQKGSSTAVQKSAGEDKLIVVDGPLGQLFTKALQVRFDKNDPAAELNNDRPKEADISMMRRVNETEQAALDEKAQMENSASAATESAAQDTFLKIAAIKSDQNSAVVSKNVSAIRISKDHKYTQDPVLLNPIGAFSEVIRQGLDVDVVFVNRGKESPVMVDLTGTYSDEHTSEFLGNVPGAISNESLVITSVSLVIDYKKV